MWVLDGLWDWRVLVAKLGDSYQWEGARFCLVEVQLPILGPADELRFNN